jgi:hypothetical protein
MSLKARNNFARADRFLCLLISNVLISSWRDGKGYYVDFRYDSRTSDRDLNWLYALSNQKQRRGKIIKYNPFDLGWKNRYKYQEDGEVRAHVQNRSGEGG